MLNSSLKFSKPHTGSTVRDCTDFWHIQRCHNLLHLVLPKIKDSSNSEFLKIQNTDIWKYILNILHLITVNYKYTNELFGQSMLS